MTLLLMLAVVTLIGVASLLPVFHRPPAPPKVPVWLGAHDVIDLTVDVCFACHRSPVSGLERHADGHSWCADPVSCALATSARLEAERVTAS